MNHEQRALIYCRVSSARQKVEGHGLDSQEQRSREYARTRSCTVEAVFHDSFTGEGDFMARPAMSALLRYLDEHRQSRYVVIFDDLKRFARDTVFHIKLRQALAHRNATVECLNFKFEDTPEGVFVETVFAAQSQLEREQNRRQVVQKMRARLERGYWPFCPPPGYKTSKNLEHGKHLVPDPETAPPIVEALEGFAMGRLDRQSDVRDFLLARGFHNKQGSGRVHLEQVKRILTRVLYTGYVEYPPWGVTLRKGHHEPLISMATYQQIQARLRGTVKAYDRLDLRAEFPLRGFLRCARCGSHLTGSWSTGRHRRYPYYRCTNSACVLRNRSIRRKDVEDHFEKLLTSMKPSANRLNALEKIVTELRDDAQERRAIIARARQEEQATLEKRIAALLERIEAATSPAVVPLYERELEGLLRQQEVLKAVEPDEPKERVGTPVSEVVEALKNPLLLWRSGSLDQRRWLVKIAFSELPLYDPDGGFGTAELSLPLALSGRFTSNYTYCVDLVRKSWNQLERYFVEACSTKPSVHLRPTGSLPAR